MTDIQVTTSQNVNITFSPASIGERMLAFAIDMLIKGAFLFVLYLVFFKLLNIGNLFDGLDSWSVFAIVILLTFPIYIYTLVTESLMEGQTFGKQMVKIKVVKIDGYQAGFGDYLIRWFFRLVDVFSNSGAVGIVTMVLSRNNRRLGDMASGTAVISLKNSVNISHTILEEVSDAYQPAFPQVLALSDNDARIIKDHFVLAVKNDDRALITKLSNKIKETLKLEIDPREYSERSFIDKILKDYNFYTGRE